MLFFVAAGCFLTDGEVSQIMPTMKFNEKIRGGKKKSRAMTNQNPLFNNAVV